MNDVARALARDNAGSVEEFAEKMNAKAAQIGMHNSNFVNPNGLPAPGQYSTARDMARLALVAYRNRTIRSIVCQKTYTWRYNDGRVRTFETTNAVLKNFAPCNGMKTGTADAAGRCLISSASYGGRDIIVVVLGDNRNVWTDSHRLLVWGLQG
jgi:D-alanyl-D-alanine carboxypeptidase (penicillin-binding protein 5/6)